MKRHSTTGKLSARGFSLIEFIVYLGIVSFVLAAAVLFSVDFVAVRAKAISLAEAARNSNFAVARLAHEVRSASGINYAASVFGANPGTLSVSTDDPATDPTVFSVSDGRLFMSQGGGGGVALTPAANEVIDFTVDDVSDSANSRSVRVRLALGTKSVGALEEFSDRMVYETTVRSWKNDGWSGDNVPPAPAPTLVQSAYRLFANADSTNVGAPLSAQDTAATLSANGAAFRLRALIHVGTSQLEASGAMFKLQYAVKSGVCDTGFSGESYADVTGATPIAYYDNPVPSDGADLTPNAGDPSHFGHTNVNQTYEEANGFTNPYAIPSGQDGMWDFALYDNDGGSTASYCLRMVNSDGSPLDSYSAVPEVTTAAGKTFRVTEYYLAAGQFTGTAYNLTLNQNLMPNYFVIVQGSDGDGSSQNNRTPAQNYAALVADPWGTGDLDVSAGANVLQLQRGAASNQWQGVVTVVECLGDCSASGFRLLDVQRVAHNTTSTSGTDTSGTAWGDVNKVLLMGGFNGAGCYTTESNVAKHHDCHVRLWPTGAATINWTRDNGGGALTTATSTVMVVEWGSEWTVQRALVSGTNGGNGINAVAEYNTAAITPVARAHTWIWGTGNTADNGVGDSAEGAVPTLGNGVTKNATESVVALGLEYNDSKSFDIYVMSHPQLAVDYRFKADGDNGLLTVDVTVDSATSGDRMAISYNGGNSTGNDYPRTMFSARYLSDTFVRLERRRSGIDFPAWVQGINFAAITQ